MLPGIAVHVIQRGNNQADCFFEQADRDFYLFHLGKMLPRARCRLHAYCLMTNHLHLLLTAEQADGCALLMKSVGQLYAQYVNRRYERSGYLWQGRFKSCLVQSEDYVLACYRYIELNPVRAGLARRPDEYPWSSYSANAEGAPSGLLSPHEEYLRLGRAPAERRAVYRDLFGQMQQMQQLDEIRTATNGGYALGNAGFKRMMTRRLGRPVDRGTAGRPPRAAKGETQPDLLMSGKNVVRP
jgi:putative transposase